MQTRQFPWEYQMDAKDCGPACIKMIAKYYGKYYSNWLVVLFFDRKVGELICSNK